MNASKLEKILVTAACILAMILVILLMVHSAQPQRAAVALGDGHRTGVYVPQATVYSPIMWTERATGGIVDRSSACHTYPIGDRFGGVDSLNGIQCVTVAQNAVQSLPVANSGIVEQTFDNTAESVTVTLPAVKVTKKHCNNGNGNGSEGCNASDKGNQDETPEKGDKADNRETGNSEQDHGNSDHGNGNGGNGH